MTAMPLRLKGLFGENLVQLTSVNQVNAHLLAYSWRILQVFNDAPKDGDARLRLLRDSCDVLLDAGLMLRAYQAWQDIEWWQLDAAEIGGSPSVAPELEQVAA